MVAYVLEIKKSELRRYVVPESSPDMSKSATGLSLNRIFPFSLKVLFDFFSFSCFNKNEGASCNHVIPTLKQL